jgi:hypothetical protein
MLHSLAHYDKFLINYCIVPFTVLTFGDEPRGGDRKKQKDCFKGMSGLIGKVG